MNNVIVNKLLNMKIMIGFDYDQMRRRRRKREMMITEFEAEKLGKNYFNNITKVISNLGAPKFR